MKKIEKTKLGHMDKTKKIPNLRENFEKTEEQKPLGVLIHSFFVIPFVIALLAVLLVTAVKLLIADRKDVYDYLNDIAIGGQSKRWQSAFELSKILKNPKTCPRDKKFSQKMIRIFDKSKNDDPRVCEYLSLAMGVTNDKSYISTLLTALEEKKKDRVFLIDSLGQLGAIKSTKKLKQIYETASREEKFAIIHAWGKMNDPQSVKYLLECMKEKDPNLLWESSVMLAQCGKKDSKKVLALMLDRSYWKKFPNVDVREQNHAMIIAIRSAVLLNDTELNEKIAYISHHDKNIRVRGVAKNVFLKKQSIEESKVS